MPNRKLLTLDEVKEDVLAKSYKIDKVVDFSNKANNFEFNGDHFILNQGNKHNNISRNGIDYLVNMINLPSSLPNKLSSNSELMTYNLNKRSASINAELRPVRNGNTIVSFVDDKKILVSNEQILDSIDKNIKGPMFDSCETNNKGSTSFNIVATENKYLKISDDDRYFEGVRIENNPLKSSSTRMESFLQRLTCLNGMIGSSAHWSAPSNIKGDIDEWLSLNMKHAIKANRKIFKSIQKLSDNKIDSDMMEFLGNMYDQLKVKEVVRDLITRRVVKEGASNMYDIFNHITYVASNYKAVRQDQTLSASLMRIGGHFAQHLEDTCKACSRPILSAS